MSIRDIRLLGDPVLKTKCDLVSDLSRVQTLVRDLLDTTQVAGRAGVAANQIGVSYSVFAYSVEGKLGYLINPQIISSEGEIEIVDEGCLSVPGIWQQVMRYPRVTVTGLQLDGSEVQIEAEGLMAQMLQHECDHLDGIVYLDRLTSENRREAMREIRTQPWFRIQL